MLSWRWLGQNPEATPAQFREAVTSIAKDVWNKHFAPVFGVEDSPVLAIYSHMVNYGLYLPNYAIGFILQQQIENYFQTHSLPDEMERMCKTGNIIPREWMQQAVGSDISAKPLLNDALKAARQL
jgi:oligoendopeptidase F